MIQLLQCDQQMHTLHYNYDTVLILKLLHVSCLTSPSSGTAHLYKTIVKLSCHPQFVELSHVRQCVGMKMDMCTLTGTAHRSECSRWTHWNLLALPLTVHIPTSILIHWRTCDKSKNKGLQEGWTTVLYNCAVPDDGLVRLETCRSLHFKTLSYF